MRNLSFVGGIQFYPDKTRTKRKRRVIMLKSIEKGIHWVSRGFALVSVVVLFLMVVFIDVDVVGRYFFKSPITGSIDFVTVMMVIVIFPAMGYVTSLNGHVRTDVIYEKFAKRGRGICDIPNSLFALFLVVAMAWRLGTRAWSITQNPPGISTAYFHWPHFPFMMLGTVGLILMALEILVQFIHAMDDAIHG
jgi:TRAP-type C4-dicarboxylate transport system permease small subunit